MTVENQSSQKNVAEPGLDWTYYFVHQLDLHLTNLLKPASYNSKPSDFDLILYDWQVYA